MRAEPTIPIAPPCAVTPEPEATYHVTPAGILAAPDRPDEFKSINPPCPLEAVVVAEDMHLVDTRYPRLAAERTAHVVLPASLFAAVDDARDEVGYSRSAFLRALIARTMIDAGRWTPDPADPAVDALLAARPAAIVTAGPTGDR